MIGCQLVGQAACRVCVQVAASGCGVHAAQLSCPLQALQRMHRNMGVGKLLVTAALREHHRILDTAIKLEDWSRAEALFVQACTCILTMGPHAPARRRVADATPSHDTTAKCCCHLSDHHSVSVIQEMRLHEAMDPRGEGLSLLHYQFATLQFILGQLEDAQRLAQQSYDLALHTYKADSDQASPS